MVVVADLAPRQAGPSVQGSGHHGKMYERRPVSWESLWDVCPKDSQAIEASGSSTEDACLLGE